MASNADLDWFYSSGLCAICGDLMREPGSVECGHNFCRTCITDWCRQANPGQAARCPQCRSAVTIESFRPNWELGGMLEALARCMGEEPGVPPVPGAAPRSQGVCGAHGEPLQLFCERDGEAVCLVCREAREHMGHPLVPIQQAAQDYRVKAEQLLVLLNTSQELAAKELSKQEARRDSWKERVRRQQEAISSEFQKAQRFLRAEELRCLRALHQEEEGVLASLEANIATLHQKASNLAQTTAALHRKCQEPDIRMLQGIKGVIERACSSLRPEPLPSPISTELRTPCSILDLALLRKFLTATITLDPATAHPELLLSPDLRSLLLADSPQTLPPDPRRFTESTSALSSQSFSAGSAYWEVTVGDRAVGMLGVCRESVQRQGPLAVSPSAGFWAVKVGGGGALAALSSPPVAVEVRTAPRAIGVLLEHEAGVVSFYNVSDGSHMFTFSDEFGEPLKAFFHLQRTAKGRSPDGFALSRSPEGKRGCSLM